MQTNKPLPHLTIRSGPWAGTMVRFATVEQLRAVQRMAREFDTTSEEQISRALKRSLNTPQSQQS